MRQGESAGAGGADRPDGHAGDDDDGLFGTGGRRSARASDERRGSARRDRRQGRRRGWSPDGPQEGSAASQGPDADPEAVARAICLRLLTMAPKTRAQLAEALRKREVPEEAAQAVLERFSEVGLIDDEAFAAAWVSSRHIGRGLARRALAQELRHRGVEEETVKEAVGRLDPEQEVETARALVARKLAATRGADPKTRTRRLAGMLARKGYSPGLAFRVVREALEAEGLDTDDLPGEFG
ncbi:recombination regulator RecX [Planotetraspora kaengkrachanensis]|uniref:recombination regulator RecX n=1 Tax=Planotetraspora kaengkrachanensis TaxID=575193 RepID=UPI001EF269BF|nr:recombination regulator RecX [Planotetraspora kaengkrachanensis]